MTPTLTRTLFADSIGPDGREPPSSSEGERPERAAWFWAGVLIAAFGVLIIAGGLRALDAARKLEASGIATTGVVTGARVRTLGEFEVRYTIDVEFADREGTPHTLTRDVSYTSYRRLRPGDSLAVTYDPAHPGRGARTAIGADSSARTAAISVALGLVLCALGWAAVVCSRRHADPPIVDAGAPVITRRSPGL